MAPSCRAPFHRPSTGRHFRSDRQETDDAPNEMRKPQHRPDPESPHATTIATAMWAKENLPNLEIVDIGEELHLAQESYPQLIGETISVWLQSVEQTHA